MYGSTIGATRYPQFIKDDEYKILPRPYHTSKPGNKGWKLVQSCWFLDLHNPSICDWNLDACDAYKDFVVWCSAFVVLPCYSSFYSCGVVYFDTLIPHLLKLLKCLLYFLFYHNDALPTVEKVLSIDWGDLVQ